MKTNVLSENSENRITSYVIEIPLDKVNVENLINLLNSMGGFINKALEINEMPIEVGKNSVKFPWFTRKLEAETLNAYIHFIFALCRMSNEKKRFSGIKTQTNNEKYTFRCFLLRLGFIGAEYRTERKILLKNFE